MSKRKYPSELNTRTVRVNVGDWRLLLEFSRQAGINVAEAFHKLITAKQKPEPKPEPAALFKPRSIGHNGAAAFKPKAVSGGILSFKPKAVSHMGIIPIKPKSVSGNGITRLKVKSIK